jgi:hypothetical protein
MDDLNASQKEFQRERDDFNKARQDFQREEQEFAQCKETMKPLSALPDDTTTSTGKPLTNTVSPSAQNNETKTFLETDENPANGHPDEVTKDEARLDPEISTEPSDCPTSLASLYRSLDRAEAAGKALKIAADSKDDKEEIADVLDSIIRLEELSTTAHGELEKIAPKVLIEREEHAAKESAKTKTHRPLKKRHH